MGLGLRPLQKKDGQRVGLSLSIAILNSTMFRENMSLELTHSAQVSLLGTHLPDIGELAQKQRDRRTKLYAWGQKRVSWGCKKRRTCKLYWLCQCEMEYRGTLCYALFLCLGGLYSSSPHPDVGI